MAFFGFCGELGAFGLKKNGTVTFGTDISVFLERREFLVRGAFGYSETRGYVDEPRFSTFVDQIGDDLQVVSCVFLCVLQTAFACGTWGNLGSTCGHQEERKKRKKRVFNQFDRAKLTDVSWCAGQRPRGSVIKYVELMIDSGISGVGSDQRCG